MERSGVITVQVADDAAAAVAGAAEALAGLMRRAVSLRGRAHVAVSGGSTPGAMFATSPAEMLQVSRIS